MSLHRAVQRCGRAHWGIAQITSEGHEVELEEEETNAIWLCSSRERRGPYDKERSMRTVRAGIDYDALVKDDRVHGLVYTDPTIFEEEMDKIFSRGWVYVGHAGEIPNPGDFRLRSIGRQSVIMVRADDGQVQLLMNRCAHRANAVCQVERGNAKMFRCAYHGWTYRTNGELASVTYADRYDASFRKENFGLRKAPRMDIYRGFVFGSLSPVGMTLDDHLDPQVKEQLDLFIDL